MDSCDQVIQMIMPANRVLILTHARPDGDAIGSCVALKLSLIGLGKDVQIGLLSEGPGKYRFLLEPNSPIELWHTPVDLADYDCVVVLDTSANVQLEGVAGQLETYRERVAVVDHHASGQPIGAARWIDPTASACGQMVHDMIRRAGWPFDQEIAEAIFVAMATDTGWFRFSNTTPEALRLAAELLEGGLSAYEIYGRVYQNESAERMALAAEMLGGIELHLDGRLLIATITQDMYARSGANPQDTEGLIDLPQAIGSVVVTVMMVERPGGTEGGVRLGFRSKRDVDVNRIAKQFGGGGHVRAAGARVEGVTLADLKPQIITACREALAAGN